MLYFEDSNMIYVIYYTEVLSCSFNIKTVNNNSKKIIGNTFFNNVSLILSGLIQT